MANSVSWYDHVLRRKDGDFLRWAFEVWLNVNGRRRGWDGRGRSGEGEGESVKVCLSREDSLCHSKQIVVANQISTKLRGILLHSHVGYTVGFMTLVAHYN